MPQTDREEVVKSANTLLSNNAAGFAIHPTVANFARAVVEMDEELKELHDLMDRGMVARVKQLEVQLASAARQITQEQEIAVHHQKESAILKVQLAEARELIKYAKDRQNSESGLSDDWNERS